MTEGAINNHLFQVIVDQVKNLFNVNHLFYLCLLSLLGSAWCLPTEAVAQVDDLVMAKVEVEFIKTTTAGKTISYAFAVPQLLHDYNGIILSGSATGNYKQGFVRFLDDATWTEWQPLKYLSTSTENFVLAGFRSNNYRSGNAFELRFDLPGGTTVDITEIGVFDNRLDDDQLNANKSNQPVQIQRSTATISPPTLIARGTWGADDFIGNPIPLANPGYNRMTFHHAACCSASTYDEGIAQVKAIQDFHQEVRGWSDIGYHFIFDQSGRLYQGRPFLDNLTNLDQAPVLSQGAHVGGANTGNIGVSVLGCYHPPEGGSCVDVMSTALRDSLVTLYAYLSERYGVTTDNLFGHRDQSATSCPGDNNYALLPALRIEIDELILSGGQKRPESFFLAESFPNPFHASTTIRYYLDHEGIIRLKVYDATGRLVSTLVDTYQEADRWYTAVFDAGNLSNGTYFCRIQVEGFSDVVFDQTQPLVLVR